MITGELKSKIDAIWDTMCSGGISNPLSVIEQLTYLLFIKRLDELHTLKEAKAARTGTSSKASWLAKSRSRTRRHAPTHRRISWICSAGSQARLGHGFDVPRIGLHYTPA